VIIEIVENDTPRDVKDKLSEYNELLKGDW